MDRREKRKEWRMSPPHSIEIRNWPEKKKKKKTKKKKKKKRREREPVFKYNI